MKAKKIIKKIPGVKFANSFAKGIAFLKDRQFFFEHHIQSDKTKEHVEFLLLMESHKLEKGFSATSMRPFGAKKINSIVDLIEKYSEELGEESFALKVANSMLISYKELYEKKGWTKLNQYQVVCEYLKKYKPEKSVDYGAVAVKETELKTIDANTFRKLLQTRHSTRAFSDQKVTKREIEKAVDIARLSPSACNRQPCKVYFVANEQNKELIEKTLPGFNLFEMKNVHVLLVTFDMSFAQSVGERNQGWFNAGLFSMNLVNALHTEGIGTCFLQWGEKHSTEKEVKQKLNIPESERIAVVIACGYYKKEDKILCSARRPVSEILRIR